MFFARFTLITQAFFYGLDWGFNPTHTQSAIRAAEIYLNQKTEYPQINAMIAKSPELLEEYNSAEFINDMAQSWDLNSFQKTYSQDTLGHEYSVFMQKLGFKPLSMNLSDSIPTMIRNILKLGVRNHDIVHFLFGLYDTDKDNKLVINDYHEWIFLFYTMGAVTKEQKVLPRLLLFPSLIKAFFTFRYSQFQKAKKIGTIMSSAQNLNLMWLKPYFHKSVKQVRAELGIKTLDYVVQIVE